MLDNKIAPIKTLATRIIFPLPFRTNKNRIISKAKPPIDEDVLNKLFDNKLVIVSIRHPFLLTFLTLPRAKAQGIPISTSIA